MPSRVQTLRSSVKSQRPAAGAHEVGTFYTNFPDRQIGVIQPGKTALDLLAVRFFSVAADYAVNDYVWNSGTLFKALVPVSAGAFNDVQWDHVVTDSEITGSMLIARIVDADGEGTELDADKLDGQHGSHYLARANHTGSLPPAALVANDLLAAIKTVDGTASGLDADLLDGRDGLYFLDRNNHSGTQPVSSITGLQAQLDARVISDSPVFTGNPRAPTAATPDNSDTIATTAHVKANLVPYAPLLSPVFTGGPKAPTPPPGDNDDSIATTAFVQAEGFAKLVSPTFVGDPKAPTPLSTDNDTTIATTAFVQALVAAVAGGIPPGTLIWTAMTVAPPGYLKADGAAVSRTTFSNLFVAIGTLYGPGDGSTTFNLPDLRGEFVRSLDDGRGIDLGRSQGTVQAAGIESHTHTFVGDGLPGHVHPAASGYESNDHQHHTSGWTDAGYGQHTHPTLGTDANVSRTPASNAAGSAAAKGSDAVSASGSQHQHPINLWSGGRNAAHTHAITIGIETAGTPSGINSEYGGTETRPRNIAMLACIKY